MTEPSPAGAQNACDWLTPPERMLANRAVERYQQGQLPAFDKAVERGGLGSLPFLVSAQLDILIAGVLIISGVVILYLSSSAAVQVVSTVLLIAGSPVFCLGVVRVFQGLLAKRRFVRGNEGA